MDSGAENGNKVLAIESWMLAEDSNDLRKSQDGGSESQLDSRESPTTDQMQHTLYLIRSLILSHLA